MPTRFPAAARIVAIGDVHGDLRATKDALRLAGAIDEAGEWIGGELVVVQTGDQLDRGDEEQAILDLLSELDRKARAAGGAVHALNGNHELMNIAGDLRYVTPGGFDDFNDVKGLELADPRLQPIPMEARARAAAFAPGGPYAKVLGRRNTIVIVGDTVFAHGGVLPEHAEKIDWINTTARRWAFGTGDPQEIATFVEYIMAETSPVWTRIYSDDVGPEDCELLDRTLRALSVRRMVVGHTVQKGGISSACDDKVWRIDVGLAAHYGGPNEVLEIAGGQVRVLRGA